MKNVNPDQGVMQLPLMRQFITGDVPKNDDFVEIPAKGDTHYVDDENGNRILRFGENARGRLLNELYKFAESDEVTEAIKSQIEQAIATITSFLGDMHVWYERDSKKAYPRIEYRTLLSGQTVFYPDHSDPAFIEYRRQLHEYDKLQLGNQSIPDQLIDALNLAERQLFYGSEREKARANEIGKFLEQQLDSPIVGLAILCILYNPDELKEVYAEADKEGAQATKTKRTKKPQTPTSFRMSGHLVDQTLKYSYSVNSKVQPSLFDSLAAPTQKSLLAAGVDRDTVVEGIQVTPAENKVIVALSKLLHRKSQNTDPKAKDYYSGMELPTEGRGRKPSLPNYKDGSEQIAPEIVVTLHELTRECIGGKAPSGKEYSNIKNTLYDLAKKQFLINYIQTTPLSDGKQLKETIQEYQNLIKVRKYNATVTDSKNVVESSSDEILISLNPIFRHKIDSKFIVVPSNYLQLLTNAYGSGNISEATMRLTNYLLREKSSNRFNPIIGMDKLNFMLCNRWAKEGRKARVTDYVNKAIETVKALNLVTRLEVVDAKHSDTPNVIFHLNKNWPDNA